MMMIMMMMMMIPSGNLALTFDPAFIASPISFSINDDEKPPIMMTTMIIMIRMIMMMIMIRMIMMMIMITNLHIFLKMVHFP